jgi:hypothetical protein
MSIGTRADRKNSHSSLLLCVGILLAACASASLVFACATPFAAFAVLAASVLPLPFALIAIALTWVVNQAIGFCVLDYPQTLNSVLWGLGIGVSALVTTAAATVLFRRLASRGRFALYPIALVGCFAVYELVLLAMTPALGGIESFSLEIVGRLAFLNAIWLAGLIVAYELLHRAQRLVKRAA